MINIALCTIQKGYRIAGAKSKINLSIASNYEAGKHEFGVLIPIYFLQWLVVSVKWIVFGAGLCKPFGLYLTYTQQHSRTLFATGCLLPNDQTNEETDLFDRVVAAYITTTLSATALHATQCGESFSKRDAVSRRWAGSELLAEQSHL